MRKPLNRAGKRALPKLRVVGSSPIARFQWLSGKPLQ